jgi:hypothetical protein
MSEVAERKPREIEPAPEGAAQAGKDAGGAAPREQKGARSRLGGDDATGTEPGRREAHADPSAEKQEENWTSVDGVKYHHDTLTAMEHKSADHQNLHVATEQARDVKGLKNDRLDVWVDNTDAKRRDVYDIKTHNRENWTPADARKHAADMGASINGYKEFNQLEGHRTEATVVLAGKHERSPAAAAAFDEPMNQQGIRVMRVPPEHAGPEQLADYLLKDAERAA